MRSYNVIIMPQAQEDLNAFVGKQLSRFEKAIMGMQEEPRPHKSKKLAGGGSRWRIRIRDYRMLYKTMIRRR